MAPEGLAEQLAGELATPVGVEDRALSFSAAVGVLQGLDAQLCPHIVIHVEALDAAVEAVHHRR